MQARKSQVRFYVCVVILLALARLGSILDIWCPQYIACKLQHCHRHHLCKYQSHEWVLNWHFKPWAHFHVPPSKITPSSHCRRRLLLLHHRKSSSSSSSTWQAQPQPTKRHPQPTQPQAEPPKPASRPGLHHRCSCP